MADEALLRDIFDRAIELSGSEREAFLEGACAGDSDLMAELRGLLAADASADSHGGWRRSAVAHEATSLAGEADPSIGETLGAYRIVGLIGKGGMGNVYRAVRADDHYQKSVALKRIQAGFHTRQIVERFREERQILARLEHANIARLLDGGADSQGLPYFVMEYVEGLSPREYCEQRGLGLRQRLELFQQVCAAVQYAHQQLVIHRDLKPANILITAEGAVKLLDFGLAKVLAAEPSDTAQTAFEARILTARYASPEQISGEPVGTSSDIYSLGMVLYELLTGASPYGKTDRTGAEWLKVVCQQEPTQPSNHVRDLKGDLDAIILKSLRKLPAERYTSTEQFSEDIRRHLEGRPVRARRDAFSYVAGKFLRRHWLPATAACITLVSLIGGLVASTHARQRAERRFEQLRKLSHAVVFDYHDSIETLPGSTPVRRRMVKDALEYLDSLAIEVADGTLERELIDGYVRVSQDQGNTYYLSLGDTEGALVSGRKAVALARELLRRDSSPEARMSAAAAFGNQGDLEYSAGDLKGAAVHYSQSLDWSEGIMREQPRNAANLTALAMTLRHAGDLSGGPGLANLGKTEDALRLYRRAGEVADQLSQLKPGEWSARKARFQALTKVAALEIITGRLTDGERDLREAYDMIQSIAAANPGNTHDGLEIASVSTRLAALLTSGGKAREAIPYLEHAVALIEKGQLEDPQATLYGHRLVSSEMEWARALRENNQPRPALAHDQAAISAALRLSKTTPAEIEFRVDDALAHHDLAETLLASHSGTRAVEEAKRAVAILADLQPMAEDITLEATRGRALRTLGAAQMAANSFDSSLENLNNAVAKLEKAAGSDPANTVFRSDLARALAIEGDCFAKLGRRDAAAEAYGRAESIWRELKDRGALTVTDAVFAGMAAGRRGRAD